MLKDGKECAWTLGEGSDPEVMAYRIREALHIASLNADVYPELAAAKSAFTIQVSGKRVEARRKRMATVHASQEEAMSHFEQPAYPSPNDVFTGLPRHSPNAELSGPKTALDVVDAWQKSKLNLLRFPDAHMSKTDLTAVYTWAKQQDPPLMLLVDHPALTIAVVDSQVVEYEWTP